MMVSPRGQARGRGSWISRSPHVFLLLALVATCLTMTVFDDAQGEAGGWQQLHDQGYDFHWVRIKAGSFQMGSPPSEAGRQENERWHPVTITRDFLIQATEVTQDQWGRFFKTNPSHFSSCGGSCPVERVNWWEALAYCNELSDAEGLEKCYELRGCGSKTPGNDMECQSVRFKGLSCQGYRLPTEAEWEYAARGGAKQDTRATYNGDLTSGTLSCERPNNVLSPIAWFCGNAGGSTKRVGTRDPNPRGLYDMLGNVYEWVWDWYDSDYPTRPPPDPLGPDAGSLRVLRGGSWLNLARYCRAANRYHEGPGLRGSRVGFRPVRSRP